MGPRQRGRRLNRKILQHTLTAKRSILFPNKNKTLEISGEGKRGKEGLEEINHRACRKKEPKMRRQEKVPAGKVDIVIAYIKGKKAKQPSQDNRGKRSEEKEA